jgi:hypothetical protein
MKECERRMLRNNGPEGWRPLFGFLQQLRDDFSSKISNSDFVANSSRQHKSRDDRTTAPGFMAKHRPNFGNFGIESRVLEHFGACAASQINTAHWAAEPPFSKLVGTPNTKSCLHMATQTANTHGRHAYRKQAHTGTHHVPITRTPFDSTTHFSKTLCHAAGMPFFATSCSH